MTSDTTISDLTEERYVRGSRDVPDPDTSGSREPEVSESIDPGADDEGPYIDDVLRCADILGVTAPEFFAAIMPLLLAQHDAQKAEVAK